MSTSYEAVKPLEPGRPVDVLERNEHGLLIGAWHGYWNYKRGTVALYPNPWNRLVWWPGGTIPSKRVVSDRVVNVRQVEPAALPPAKKTKPEPREGTSDGMQETIKFN